MLSALLLLSACQRTPPPSNSEDLPPWPLQVIVTGLQRDGLNSTPSQTYFNVTVSVKNPRRTATELQPHRWSYRVGGTVVGSGDPYIVEESACQPARIDRGTIATCRIYFRMLEGRLLSELVPAVLSYNWVGYTAEVDILEVPEP